MNSRLRPAWSQDERDRYAAERDRLLRERRAAAAASVGEGQARGVSTYGVATAERRNAMNMNRVQLSANYRVARQALENVAKVDEAKDILDQSMALAVYAYQHKDPDLARWTTEIKDRAVIRIGEIIAERSAAGKMAKGARGQLRGRDASGGVSKTQPENSGPTLEQLGVDKNLAKKARKYAAMPHAEREAMIAEHGEVAAAAASGAKEAVKAFRQKENRERKKRREQKEQALAAKIAALPAKRYGVILADPEWRFEPYSRETGMDRAADNHYPTSELADIAARDVASIAADDCVLFLWTTTPMLADAVLEVMPAWGFEYKSHFIWKKDRIGTGFWNRNQHKLLLVGTRGNVPAPAPGTQFPSVIEAPVGAHSEKPEAFYELIESYFPNVPKIELNARQARSGWDRWGLEAPA
jgi:N6-adenosine-specific RNA methylase IME4